MFVNIEFITYIDRILTRGVIYMDYIAQELLGVDHNRAFNFFLSGLADISNENKTGGEIMYVASVLAHYSQTSVLSKDPIGPFSNLSQVSDIFFFNNPVPNDPEILEIGGSQILLLSGFFREQMKRRYNVSWYDNIGCMFYERAASISTDKNKRELFFGLSSSLPKWNLICSRFGKECLGNRFLLEIN